MKTIEYKNFDEERALYNICDTAVKNCTFAGPADGESALKETHRIKVDNCSFSLLYPLWHSTDFTLSNSTLDEMTRAPIWYAERGEISDCTINGIKCLRECDGIKIKNCTVASPEFGWRCRNIEAESATFDSVYFFFESENVRMKNITMKGKYSFQYTKEVEITDSELDTKDAFWHAKNVTVKNSTVKGEYLGWFSDGLTLINCKIIGTQPLCYCTNLTLIACEMIDTDLSFERSEVEATLTAPIVSIKNPYHGRIRVPACGELIKDDPNALGEVIITGIQ